MEIRSMADSVFIFASCMKRPDISITLNVRGSLGVPHALPGVPLPGMRRSIKSGWEMFLGQAIRSFKVEPLTFWSSRYTFGHIRESVTIRLSMAN